MMKNLNIMGVHLKIRFWGGRAVGGVVFTKNQYIGGNCQKSGAWTVFRLKGGLKKKRGWCF